MRAWVLDSVGQSVRCGEVADPVLSSGGAVIRVLAAHLPAYTRAVAGGARGYSLPTPLVLGPACVGLVEAVAEDVFNVAAGDIVLNSSLLSSGDVDGLADEILIGWTGVGWRGTVSERSLRMQALWRNGVFAQRALCPKESLVRLAGAETYPEQAKLAFLPWLAIAEEGLRRGDLEPGHVVVIAGATGQLGGAATLVALAHGASRVVALGRNRAALDTLAGLDRRVVPIALSGRRDTDATALTDATGGGADVVLDVLGDVPDAQPTLSCFDTLRPGGTMVLVGGVKHDLPLPYGRLMRRRLTVRGSFMFDARTATSVWRMVATDTINLSAVGARVVDLNNPPAAIELAAATTGLNFVALQPDR